MLDATFQLSTIDDIIIFHNGKVISPDKDAKVGYYSVEFDLPPFYLNTGKYKFEIWFGENQKHLLWGDLVHMFEIDNTLTGQGYNLSTLPGVLKPNLDFKVIHTN